MDKNKIYGENKDRDYQIIQDYLEGIYTLTDLGAKYNLSDVRIGQIVSNNITLIDLDISKEKVKRIMWLRNQIAKKGDTKKDPADLQEQLRKELEGDKPLIEQHTHFEYSWEEENRIKDTL